MSPVGPVQAHTSGEPAAGLSLQFNGVSVRLAGARAAGGDALRDVNLSIGSGAQVAVVGPSGAGKTTLLMTAAGTLRPSQGQVLIERDDPWELAQRRRHRLRGRLFLAPQIPPLPPRQRVVTAVLAGRLPAMGFWRSLRSLFYPVDIAAAYAALEPFELAERLFDRVDRLSGGERQRVSLARALVAPARLWLLDEPLSGLDPARAAQAVRILREQAAQRAITLVVSMHQVELALEHFPRLIGLREGSVAFDSPAADVSRETLQRLYGPAGDGGRDGPAPDEAWAADAEPPAVALHFR